MKTKSTMFCFAMMFLVGNTQCILGQDLNPPQFRTLPASVFGTFGFDVKSNPVSPDDFNWVEGPQGEPLFDEFQPCIEFNEQFFSFDQGVWINSSPKPALFKIKAPNIEDDFEVKLIRLQIAWVFNGASNPPMINSIIGEDAEDGPLTQVTFVGGSTVSMGNMRHTTYNILVRPNPDWEMIDILVRPGMGIKHVVIDTISLPGAIPGDVNGDNLVNLLDVAPFVFALVNGDYLLAADVNTDGDLNLVDVPLFAEALSN